MCSKAKSPLHTTVRRCVSSAGGVCLRRALSPAAQLILYLSTCKVCVHPSALLCFVCLTSHMSNGFSTGTAATLYLPCPRTRMMSLFVRPSGSSLSSFGSERSVLYLKTLYSIGRLPPYWDITKSPIRRSALTPIGRSFEIGRSNLGALRCTTPPYIGPPTVK